LVTPTQAIIGRKGPFKYRLYFGVGGLAFGLLVGVLEGMRIGRHSGDHAASADGSGAVKQPARPRWRGATTPFARRPDLGQSMAERKPPPADASNGTHELLARHPAQPA
jgi:hypothetical protein